MNALVRLIAYRLRFWIKGFAFIQFKCIQQCVCPWAIVKLLLNEFQFRMIVRTEDQSKNNNFDSFFLDSNTHAKWREKKLLHKNYQFISIEFFLCDCNTTIAYARFTFLRMNWSKRQSNWASKRAMCIHLSSVSVNCSKLANSMPQAIFLLNKSLVDCLQKQLENSTWMGNKCKIYVHTKKYVHKYTHAFKKSGVGSKQPSKHFISKHKEEKKNIRW